VKQVLIFSYVFPPLGGGGVQRTLKFVKYLPSRGYRPLVVTTGASWYGRRDESLRAEIPADVPVTRAREVAFMGMRMKLARATRNRNRLHLLNDLMDWPDRFNGWVPAAVASGLRVARRHRPDLIYSSSRPFSAHLAAWLTHRLSGIPWVPDFRDDWARNPWAPKIKTQRFNEWVEARLCRDAACVVAVHPVLRVGSGVPADDAPGVEVIPNGVDLDDFTGPQPTPPKDRLVLSQVGTIYGPRIQTMRHLISGIELSVQRGVPVDQLELRIVGKGAALQGSQVRVKAVGYVSHTEAIREMRSATALILPGSADAYAGAVPAKLYEYLASGRPIIGLVDPDRPVARMISEAKAGWVVHPRDEETIAKVIEELHQSWRAGDLDGCRPIPGELLRPYERSELTGRLAAVFDAVVG
jgi:glycosyltransferase involved in cell wall biosynthesis